MFVRVLICCCSLAIVFSAPVYNGTSTIEPKPTPTPNVSTVNQPNATEEKINYELHGKCPNDSIVVVYFFI